MCAINLEDIDLNMGGVTVLYSEGGKGCTVFLDRTTRRAARAYLRLHHDDCKWLFVASDGGALTYDGLDYCSVEELDLQIWKSGQLRMGSGARSHSTCFAMAKMCSRCSACSGTPTRR